MSGPQAARRPLADDQSFFSRHVDQRELVGVQEPRRDRASEAFCKPPVRLLRHGEVPTKQLLDGTQNVASASAQAQKKNVQLAPSCSESTPKRQATTTHRPCALSSSPANRSSRNSRSTLSTSYVTFLRWSDRFGYRRRPAGARRISRRLRRGMTRSRDSTGRSPQPGCIKGRSNSRMNLSPNCCMMLTITCLRLPYWRAAHASHITTGTTNAHQATAGSPVAKVRRRPAVAAAPSTTVGGRWRFHSRLSRDEGMHASQPGRIRPYSDFATILERDASMI